MMEKEPVFTERFFDGRRILGIGISDSGSDADPANARFSLQSGKPVNFFLNDVTNGQYATFGIAITRKQGLALIRSLTSHVLVSFAKSLWGRVRRAGRPDIVAALFLLAYQAASYPAAVLADFT